MNEIFESLKIIYSLKEKTEKYKVNNFLDFTAFYYFSKLDLLHSSISYTKFETESKKIFDCRVISLVIITFLDDSRGVFNSKVQSEIEDLGCKNELNNLKIHNSNVNKFRVANESYFREIRNSSFAHKKNGILKAIENDLNMDTDYLALKSVDLLNLFKKIDDEILQILQTILIKVK